MNNDSNMLTLGQVKVKNIGPSNHKGLHLNVDLIRYVMFASTSTSY